MIKKLFYVVFIVLVCAVNTSVASTEIDAISFQFEEPTLSELKKAKSNIIASGLAEQIASYINSSFKLPAPVTILFSIGSEEGPYYDPDSRHIIVPYAFWIECRKQFAKEFSTHDSKVDLQELCTAVMVHTIYHELGHAFIDVCQLPITGKEENVADEFAVLLLLDSFENGNEMALIAGDYFALEGSKLEEVTDEDLFDEHALDDQRFFTTFCVAYGMEPDDELERDAGA